MVYHYQRYAEELKEHIVAAILRQELTPVAAATKHGVSISTIRYWLKQVRAAAQAGDNGAMKLTPPLPRGLSLKDAIKAVNYCDDHGWDSPAAGQYCRKHGLLLEQVKKFNQWYQHIDDLVPAEKFYDLQQEHTQVTQSLRQAHKELHRKDKALAETAALLVLSKKAAAIWADKEN